MRKMWRDCAPRLWGSKHCRHAPRRRQTSGFAFRALFDADAALARSAACCPPVAKSSPLDFDALARSFSGGFAAVFKSAQLRHQPAFFSASKRARTRGSSPPIIERLRRARSVRVGAAVRRRRAGFDRFRKTAGRRKRDFFAGQRGIKARIRLAGFLRAGLFAHCARRRTRHRQICRRFLRRFYSRRRQGIVLHARRQFVAGRFIRRGARADGGRRIILWAQNSHPTPIPAGAIGIGRMGDDDATPYAREIPPFATRAINLGEARPRFALAGAIRDSRRSPLRPPALRNHQPRRSPPHQSRQCRARRFARRRKLARTFALARQRLYFAGADFAARAIRERMLADSDVDRTARFAARRRRLQRARRRNRAAVFGALAARARIACRFDRAGGGFGRGRNPGMSN